MLFRSQTDAFRKAVEGRSKPCRTAIADARRSSSWCGTFLGTGRFSSAKQNVFIELESVYKIPQRGVVPSRQDDGLGIISARTREMMSKDESSTAHDRRSEERRVGKECVRTCRNRGTPNQKK